MTDSAHAELPETGDPGPRDVGPRGAGDERDADATTRAAAAAARLADVVDDTGGRDETAEWVADELLRGRAFEDVMADLVGQGWADEAASRIVEEAREATRRDRGVRTREDVARGVARRYARSVRLVRWLVIIGIVAVAVIGSMFLGG